MKKLKNNAKYIVNINIAPDEDDILRATDYIIKIDSGTVACRIRREHPTERGHFDFTLRSRRLSGKKTELPKIKKGFARWYLYGWFDSNNNIINPYVFIDLDIIRKKKIIEKYEYSEIPNTDHTTWFVAIPIYDLRDEGCIVSSSMKYFNIKTKYGLNLEIMIDGTQEHPFIRLARPYMIRKQILYGNILIEDDVIHFVQSNIHENDIDIVKTIKEKTSQLPKQENNTTFIYHKDH